MARLDQIPEPMRSYLADLPCPTFTTTPWVPGPELARRRVAIISTAGVHRRDDHAFSGTEGDYRIIPGDTPARELIMTHVSSHFDRTGFAQDWNVVFPLDRLHQLAREQAIGSVAEAHYSFMGAATPEAMFAPAQNLAQLLHSDQVDAAFLVPV